MYFIDVYSFQTSKMQFWMEGALEKMNVASNWGGYTPFLKHPFIR